MSKQMQSTPRPSEYKLYDFRKPRKINKEELKGLNIAADSFSKQMEICLSGITREICCLYNPKIDEMSFESYLASLSDRTMLGFFSLNTENPDLHDGEVMFNFPSNLFFILMDILLGGTGKTIEIERPHTDIEIAICRYLMLKFQSILNDAWSTTVKSEFSFEKIEISTKNVALKGSNEDKVVMSFDVSVKNVTGTISVAFSSRFIEALMCRLLNKSSQDGDEQHTETERDVQRRKTIMNSLSNAELELTAVLADLTLNMQDIISLSEGDIIPLDKKISDSVEIRVENVPWFYGKPGNGSFKKAVKVTEIVKKDDLK